MVGSDIVDLAEAKQMSNWERPRFLEKLFTKDEQQLIHNSENSFLIIWRLWSMKEAAYKLYTQLNPSRFFNPKAFECSIENLNGKIRFKDFCCFVNTEITSQYILSEARLKAFKMTSETIELKDKNQKAISEITKLALLNRISEMYNVSKVNLKFEKSEYGIPMVHFNSEKINVSLSHHGNFATYVFTILDPTRFKNIVSIST